MADTEFSEAPAADATEVSVSPEDSPQPEKSMVASVLGRLRPSDKVPAEISELVRTIKKRHSKPDVRSIVHAFELARDMHRGQRRLTGGEFIEHPVGVAQIVASLGLDSGSVVAALLHDTVEDTELTLDDVKESFGEQVAMIIDGLTKIDKIEFRSLEQEKVTNLRKMIVAMAKDLRVLVIKLADRLHNLRTLAPLEKSKQESIATETLEIYAALAHRLGMQQVRAELEDLSFKALHPAHFVEISQMVSDRQPERERFLDKAIPILEDLLKVSKIRGEVNGRSKHYYSIYEKLMKGRDFDDIYDLVGVRIIVDSVKDCYGVLGIIHSAYKPIPHRFRDFIAVPKFNLYQSLHTTVVGPEGKPLEVQIRTEEMHRIAEWGVASHFQYKEGETGSSGEQVAWMRRMLDLMQTEDESEFLESLRLDLFSDEVYVFTPQGDVIELPKGATPIDFAYQIHTEVGHSCVGSRVDGRLVPLDYELSSGETVEVMTSKSSGSPSRDWLDIVVTPRARTKIKQWFGKERRAEAETEGKEAVRNALRRAGLPIEKTLGAEALGRIVKELNLSDTDALYVEIGEGRQSPQSIVARILKSRVTTEPDKEDFVGDHPVRTKPLRTQGVRVKGIDDIWVNLAKCCMPVPGDDIIGFVTQGRGVSVHRPDCTNGKSLSEKGERLIEVSWDMSATGTFPTALTLEALDRPKLLRDVTTTLSDFGVNIISINSDVGGGIAKLHFVLELADQSQIATIMSAMRRVESVYDAYRASGAKA